MSVVALEVYPGQTGMEVMDLFRKESNRRETICLSEVRPLPVWAPYADKMTQELADQVRSDVEVLNYWDNERRSGDNAG